MHKIQYKQLDISTSKEDPVFCQALTGEFGQCDVIGITRNKFSKITIEKVKEDRQAYQDIVSAGHRLCNGERVRHCVKTAYLVQDAPGPAEWRGAQRRENAQVRRRDRSFELELKKVAKLEKRRKKLLKTRSLKFTRDHKIASNTVHEKRRMEAILRMEKREDSDLKVDEAIKTKEADKLVKHTVYVSNHFSDKQLAFMKKISKNGKLLPKNVRKCHPFLN